MLLDLDLEALADLIVQTTKEALAPYQTRITSLEAELVAVKAAAPVVADQAAVLARIDALDVAHDSIQRNVKFQMDLQATAFTLKAADQFAPMSILERVAELESRAAVPGPQGEPGDRGPEGPVGPSGPAGARGDVGAIGARGEKGESGQTGERGLDGLIGPPGPAGERGAIGEKGMSGQVGDRGPEGPLGRDGTPGRDGLPGVPGPMGEKGADGLHGKDGAPGKDGRDGTLENLKIQGDGERTVTFTFKDGTPIDGGTLTFPVTIYRRVYEAGKAYAQGDSVTFGGHQWIALEPTTAKPAEGKSWQLAVRAGRDGREGKPGPEGGRGPKGDKGDPGVYR